MRILYLDLDKLRAEADLAPEGKRAGRRHGEVCLRH